jgi:hypothetical protein
MAIQGKVSYEVIDKGKMPVNYLINPPSEEMELGKLLAFSKEALISVAKAALDEEQKKGFDKSPVTIVDNKVNGIVENVRPFGKIDFVARGVLKEVLLDTYRQILFKSKVVTGRYFAGNIVTLNGVQIATSMTELEMFLRKNTTFNPNDKFRFINVEPYARKLENAGVTKFRTSQKKAWRKKKRGRQQVIIPNGVYALTYASVKRKFKTTANIQFEFETGARLGIIGYGKFKTGTKRQIGRPYLYPTILITTVGGNALDVGVLQ